MDPTTGLLTTLLNMFTSATTGGYAEIAGRAEYILYHIIVIEIVIAVGFNLIWQMSLGFLLWRIIVIGFVIWLTYNFSSIINMVIESFFNLGLMASNADVIPLDMRDPSRLVDMGFNLTRPIAEYLGNISLWQSMMNLQDSVMMGLAMIGIVLAFIIMAIQVFVLYLEFTIISTFAVIFVPFGALMTTSFMMDRVIMTVIAFGVRFTTLTSIVAIGSSVIQSFVLPDDPTWQQAFSMLAACGALSVLAWHAPAMAASLLGGGPSLSAATIASSAIAGGEISKAVAQQGSHSAGTAKQMGSIMAAASASSIDAVKTRIKK